MGRDLGGARAPTRSTAARPAPRSTRSTRLRRPSAAPAHRPRLLATRTPTSSPATSGCAGKEVFYPMGWDDNGLPTERRVQNYYGVRCDPTLPYDPDFTPPEKPDPKRPGADQPAQLRRALRAADGGGREGLRVAVAQARARRSTGSRPTRRSARARAPRRQRAFLRNLARGEAYQAEAPTLWDVDLPDRGRAGRARGPRVPGRTTTGWRSTARTARSHIETTRPELIAACVALIAHPDDERYQAMFGTTVRSPIFGVELPVLAHHAGRARQGRRHRDVLHVR